MTRSRENVKATYDRLSGWYDLLTGPGEKKLRELGLRELNVRAGERDLEICFGTGHALAAPASRARTRATSRIPAERSIR